MSRPPTIFISAAEASGDEHASHLIRAVLRRAPEVRFVGVAGPKMAEAGCRVLADLTARASMLGGPILRIGYWVRMVRRLRRAIRDTRPDLHVPVDSPALNWHLADAARRCGAKVLYYIAPQVWAWGRWRVRKLARLTDQVACILPFEERYLQDRGVNATYVGHPLFDAMPARPDPPPDLTDAWANGAWRVALLTGSRPGEIAANALGIRQAADRIRKRWPASRCTFAANSEAAAEGIRAACGPDGVEIAVGRTRQVLAESHFAIAVSGTVTLEAAWFGVPMAIVYRVHWLNRLLGRLFVRIPRLSLVNILAGRELVPELMPWSGGGRELIGVVTELMDDLGWLLEVRKDLTELVSPLRVPPPATASDNAARLVVDLLGRA